MKAIRGAVTVTEDTPDEIKGAVWEVLTNIRERNGLSPEQFICILFSNTSDLKSYYPAKAAREAGFSFCALYSSLEPPIEGSLEKCIRVMVLAETDRPPRHVYLGKAAALRKDLSSNFNIAIDGPAGSGKSTVAKALSKEFGILYLDTGAMYRACALKCVKDNVDVGNEKAVENVIGALDLQIRYADGKQITMLDRVDVSEEIRKPQISDLASKVSAYGFVREKMVEMQRKIASEMSCVLDGRDIGTNVLPNAAFKFYLTASAEVRADRRFKENCQRGFCEPYDKILSEIKERDERDRNRKIAPLKCARDAVKVDTSDMNIEEVVSFIKKKIQEKI